MTPPTLLGISGALRSGSTNSLLLREAARHFGDATYVQADLNLPLYNGDDEARDGAPATVQTLVEQIRAADAVVIASPEYNGGISGVLKNALDWVSRADTSPWPEKPVAVMAAAAGRTGGARGITMLRTCLAPFQARLINGPEILLAESYAAFDDAGHLNNARTAENLKTLMTTLRSAL